MRPPDVIGLTGTMPTPLPPDPRPEPEKRRTSTLVWALFVSISVVLGFLLLLPAISTLVIVVLWGLGGSGSNK
jgi:hypothetical protein